MQEEENNAPLVELWNTVLADAFLDRRDLIEEGGRRHSDEALSRYPITSGERAIDLGCGSGDTVVDLARRVGESGQVLAIDCSRRLLDAARERSARAGAENVRFLCCDAQEEPLGEGFDVCFSRFGSMFFAAPVKAFRNIRRSLRGDGRLLLVTWRPVEVNDWWRVGREAVAEFLSVPPASRSGSASAFGLSEPDHIGEVLTQAGFVDIAIEPIDVLFPAGQTTDEAAEVLLGSGAPAQALRNAGERGKELRPAIVKRLKERLEAYRGPNGVEIASASWCVAARNPGGL